MAITIKKSTLTLKKPDEFPVAETAPHVTSGPVLSTVSGPAPSWTLYAIAGVIGTLFMVALIFFQFIEYTHYKNAFPVRVAQASTEAPAQPAAKSEPVAMKPAAEAPAKQAKEPATATSAPEAAPAPAAASEDATAPASASEPEPGVTPAAADTEVPAE